MLFLHKSMKSINVKLIKLDYTSIYITDGSYRQYSSTPYAGVKAWYKSANHSAVCTGTIENSSYYVTAKWEMCVVYQHF